MSESFSKHDQVLLGLVMNLQHATMIQLGKVADPATGEVARHLEAARATIDILEMLKAKCRQATPDDLVKMIDQVVMELQMNYLDEMKKPSGGEQDGAEENEGAAETTEDTVEDPDA
jgi:hypothetical protein